MIAHTAVALVGAALGALGTLLALAWAAGPVIDVRPHSDGGDSARDVRDVALWARNQRELRELDVLEQMERAAAERWSATRGAA